MPRGDGFGRERSYTLPRWEPPLTRCRVLLERNAIALLEHSFTELVLGENVN